MKVLHVASEIYPVIKTGGLADVAYALPRAEHALGIDTRLLLPGYPAVLEGIKGLKTVAELGCLFGAACVRVKKGTFPETGLATYVIDAPGLYNRTGNPYVGPDGNDWPDNHRRFGLLGWVAAHLAAGEIDRKFRPSIVHAHDWHAGLTPAYMAEIAGLKAKSVFTIHNLAYRGLFDYDAVKDLQFSELMKFPLQFEFYGKTSFLKAGIVFANKVTTVSPTYAKEVLTEEMGCGMQGVLAEKYGDFEGVLNGLDYDVWNPENDKAISATYTSGTLEKKALCKKALCEEFGILDPAKPLFGIVSRLADQKGLDLMLEALPALMAMNANFILLGSGDKTLETGFKAFAEKNKGRVAAFIGYNETLSHRLVAGVDSLIVPSRFEPCGLTQIMALRYGTLPLVRRTGGLADTIMQATETEGVGFLFEKPTTEELVKALNQTVAFYGKKEAWLAAQKRAMACNYSWENAARRYEALYRSALR